MNIFNFRKKPDSKIANRFWNSTLHILNDYGDLICKIDESMPDKKMLVELYLSQWYCKNIVWIKLVSIKSSLSMSGYFLNTLRDGGQYLNGLHENTIWDIKRNERV